MPWVHKTSLNGSRWSFDHEDSNGWVIWFCAAIIGVVLVAMVIA